MKSGDVLLRDNESTKEIGVQEKSRRLTLYFQLTFILAIALLLSTGGNWLVDQVNMQILPDREAMILLAVIAYTLLMVIPFTPAIEVGIGLMLFMGSTGAVVAYVCTLIALSISFFIGRVVPPRVICQFFRWLHLTKASGLIAELEPLRHQERLELLHAKAPSKLTPFLLRHRYLAIAIVLNLPGNALIGGGGGIGLVAGMGKIINFRAYIAVVAVAIAPLPLWFYLHGA